MSPARIGVVGSGVTGTRVVAQLVTLGGTRIAVTDSNRLKAHQLAASYRNDGVGVDVVDNTELTQCHVVVLACAKPHVALAKRLLGMAIHVVSMSDDLGDTMQLLQLHETARQNNATLVLGAAVSPGLSGLLIHHATRSFDLIDEVHIALHGTGGPNCAHQHHDALAGQSVGWHDTDWLSRPAGSGRELCWFPEPVGAYDCYRAEMTDPILLKHAMPQLRRISARMSATRRDRLTGRLPMLFPPHAEGGMGGLRVEVRGWHSGSRGVSILGVADQLAHIAGVVAGSVIYEIASGGVTKAGVVTLGSPDAPNTRLLETIQQSGIRFQEFVGN